MNYVCRLCGKESERRFVHGYVCEECCAKRQLRWREARARKQGRELRAKQMAKGPVVVLEAIRSSMPAGISARELGMGAHNHLIKLEEQGLVFWDRESSKWFLASAVAETG